MFRRLAEWLLRDPAVEQGLYSSELKRAIRKYGRNSEQALSIRRDHSMALYRRGQADQGLAELSAVIDCRREGVGGDDDLFLRETEFRRVFLQFKMGRFEAMERESRILSDKYDRLLGSGHPHTVGMHEDHALALSKLGRIREAEAEMVEVVAGRAALGGSEDVATLRARISHAECLSALGRYDEAEVAWGALAAVDDRLLRAAHADTLEVKRKHAEALYRLGRGHEAAEEFGEVAAMSATALGAEHPATERASDWRDAILIELDSPS